MHVQSAMIYILVFIYYTRSQSGDAWNGSKHKPVQGILHEIFRIEGTEPRGDGRGRSWGIKKDAKGTYGVGHVQAAAAAKQKTKSSL